MRKNPEYPSSDKQSQSRQIDNTFRRNVYDGVHNLAMGHTMREEKPFRGNTFQRQVDALTISAQTNQDKKQARRVGRLYEKYGLIDPKSPEEYTRNRQMEERRGKKGRYTK